MPLLSSCDDYLSYIMAMTRFLPLYPPYVESWEQNSPTEVLRPGLCLIEMKDFTGGPVCSMWTIALPFEVYFPLQLSGSLGSSLLPGPWESP